MALSSKVASSSGNVTAGGSRRRPHCSEALRSPACPGGALRAAPFRAPLSSRSGVLARVAAPARPELFMEPAPPAPAPPPPAPARVAWYDKGCPPNMKNVTGGIQQLVDELADAGDKLVIVEFFAPWCAACKAVFPKICQIVSEHQEEVVFLKLSYEDNKDLCRTMGVKVLPYFHVYHGALGRVAQFSCTVSKIQRFRDALDQHLGAICSLEEPQALVEEFPEVHPHHPLILETHDDDMYDHPPAPYSTSPDRPTQLSH